MRESDGLASAFVELEAIVRNNAKLPGLEAARLEAERRRGRRVAWMVGAAAVLVLVAAVPTIGLAWLRRVDPPVLEPSPSVTPSPSATSLPTPTAVFASMTPPERVRNASLDVPPFGLAGCDSGEVEFANGEFPSEEGAKLLIETAATGDVDGDDREDVVVTVRCSVPAGMHSVSETQLLAYSGPELALLGPVAVGGNQTDVAKLLVNADGEIEFGLAQVGTSPPTESIAFDRYRWTGSAFESVDHLEVPGDALPGAVVTATPRVLDLVPGGPVQTVVVTVRTDGPTAGRPLRLDVDLPGSVTMQVEGFAGLSTEPATRLLIAPPASGEAMTITLRIGLPAGATLPPESSMMVSVFGHRSRGDDSGRFEIDLKAS